jgi:hypothetical protein
MNPMGMCRAEFLNVAQERFKTDGEIAVNLAVQARKKLLAEAQG